jgi:hypothetical protein
MVAVVSGVIGVIALVVGVLALTGRGPFAAEPEELTLRPLQVRTLGEGGDPLVVSVMFQWPEEGFCSGQFTVTARESKSTVSLSEVKGFRMPPDTPCAGLGTLDGLASAVLTLEAPLGDRAVTRAVDGRSVPVVDPCERDGMPAWCPRES